MLENKDTYWSFGEWNTGELFLGRGLWRQEAFQSTGAALAQTMREVQAGHALYFGDLDPKGFAFLGIQPQNRNRPAAGLACDGALCWLVSNGVSRPKPECTEAPPDLAASWREPLASAIQAIWKKNYGFLRRL